MPREQYEVRWKDYYQLLRVEPTADDDAIAAAYRRLARAHHPDRNRSPGATERFQEINEAKEVLTDRNRRAIYDQLYRARQRSEHFEEPGEDARNPYERQERQREESRQGQGSSSHYSRGTHQEEPGTHRSGRSGGYRWGGHRSNGGWDRQRSWNSGAGRQEQTGQPHPEEAPAEEKREKVYSSRFFVLALISYLVDRLSPGPDESQRILPWPAWAWQRAILMAGIPLASLVFLVSIAQGLWPVVVCSALWFGAALYSGIKTRWLRGTGQAEPWARVAGGSCIVVSGLGYTLALAYAALIIALLVAAFLMMLVVLRAMLDQTMDRR